MENSMKGVIGILLITGVIVGPVAQRISGAGSDLSTETMLGMIDTKTNLIKLASKADMRTKNTVKILLEMGALPTHERALYPNTLTGDDIAGLIAFLEQEEVSDASFIQDAFPHCQKWLIFGAPGQTKFVVTPDMIGAYYSSLTSEHISSLKPAARVSETLNQKATAVDNFCGSTCIATVSCGYCWELRKDLLDAEEKGNLDRVLEIDAEMRETSCAVSCGDFCSSIYGSLSLISNTEFMSFEFDKEDAIIDAQAKIDFIDLGIGLP